MSTCCESVKVARFSAPSIALEVKLAWQTRSMSTIVQRRAIDYSESPPTYDFMAILFCKLQREASKTAVAIQL